MRLSQLTNRLRQARSVKLDTSAIQKWRKDLLLLLRNVDRLVVMHHECCSTGSSWAQTDEQKEQQARRDRLYAEFSRARNTLRKNFDEFFFEGLIKQVVGGLSDDWKDYWDKKLRKALWGVSSGLTSEAWPWRGSGSKTNFELWADRLKRAMREAWKALDEFTAWYQGRYSKEVEVEQPEIDLTEIEGFPTKVIGYDASNPDHVETLGRLTAALRVYRQKATRVLPQLVKEQRPLVLSYVRGGESYFANYTPSRILINMVWVPANTADTVKSLAHEMGHHVFKTLSSTAQTFWSQTVRENWGPLDLQDLLDRWPAGERRVSGVADHFRDSDPALSIQLDILWAPEGGDRTQASTKEEVEALVAKGTTVYVPKNPVTRYGSKNPEEAFCEAVGLLVAYGPRTVHPLVRKWLHDVLPSIREGHAKVRLSP